MEKEKRKPGRPFGSVQDVTFKVVTIRLDEADWTEFVEWNSNASASIREFIRKSNEKHRRDVLNGKA